MIVVPLMLKFLKVQGAPYKLVYFDKLTSLNKNRKFSSQKNPSQTSNPRLNEYEAIKNR
jgi:hypothetical protein